MKSEAVRILDNLKTPYGELSAGQVRDDIPDDLCEQLIRQGKAERVKRMIEPREPKTGREIADDSPGTRPTSRRSADR